MSTFEYRGTRKTLRVFPEIPLQITKTSRSEPAQLVFPNGGTCASSCIGCVNEPCRLLSAEEGTVEGVSAFAGDTSSALCPTKAISWDFDLEVPKVDPNACISCGLCVSRCPIGAISIQGDVAVVSTDEGPTDDCQWSTLPYSTGQDRQRSQLASLPQRELREPILDDLAAVHLATTLSKASDVVQKAAVRSALVAAQCSVSLSRKGDVHTRMDGTYSTTDGVCGSLEVEFGLDSLEAVRATLDDVAVLNSRYGIQKSEQTPLVVCGELPRERQGYWQVIQDIYRVLDIKVRTATLGSLLLLVWNDKRFTAATLNELTPHFGSTSIREQIEEALGRSVTIAHGHGGVLEPEK